MALTISRRSCCIFAIPNPARWARHADSIGSISDQRASDRSVRYARRGVFTRLLYQSNIDNGGTSAVSSLPRSYQIMPKRDEMPSKITDAELITVAVMQVLLGFHDESRWIRYARK